MPHSPRLGFSSASGKIVRPGLAIDFTPQNATPRRGETDVRLPPHAALTTRRVTQWSNCVSWAVSVSKFWQFGRTQNRQ